MPAFAGTAIGGKFGLMRLALAFFEVGGHRVLQTRLGSQFTARHHWNLLTREFGS